MQPQTTLDNLYSSGVHVCAGVWGVCVCVCVCACVGVACLSAFVSALGSQEMGRHKLPIIITIIIIIINIYWRIALCPKACKSGSTQGWIMLFLKSMPTSSVDSA